MRRAFTFIELLIVMALAGLLFALVASIYVSSSRVTTSEMKKINLRQDMSSALYQMTQGLEQAKEITAASSGAISFWVDADWDDTQDTGEVSSYSWTGASNKIINYTNSGLTRSILRDVTAFSMTYDAGTPANIHLATISLTQSREGEQLSLKTSVKARNVQ